MCFHWLQLSGLWDVYDWRYLFRVMSGSGGRALSTGYRSLTAILTSSASAVRNLSRFRMMYSWSARMMLPWWTNSRVSVFGTSTTRVVVPRLFWPCRRVRWSGGRPLRRNRTGCRRSCRFPAAWPESAAGLSDASDTTEQKQLLLFSDSTQWRKKCGK